MKKMDRRSSGRIWIAVVALVAVVAFIWGNSLESVPESKARSLAVLRMVSPVLEPIVGRGNVTDHLVRKLAHLVEYGVLGCMLALMMVLRRQVRLQAVANCLFAGLSAAVTDEVIQLFSNRGAQVQDIALDFGAVAAGIVLVVLIDWLLRKVRPDRRG